MSSSEDVLRKVGRGGAGNFYSVRKEDELAAEKVPTISICGTKTLVPKARKRGHSGRKPSQIYADLQRQDDESSPVVSSQGSNVRAGRGGAGNFIDPSQLPDAQGKARMSKEVTEAVTSSLKKHPQRMGGRGGAGNWAGEEQKESADEEQGLSKTEELERRIKDAVEKGLRVPEKVHHGREKDVKQ
ncbi:hypothetical protein C2857_005635 [Epichloe festucae Fl1]|uniref:Uncharacterized protein n=1 Tax=Epichloe festucae (strain Fl1) TaxID=877507 RepID=A0A7S9KT18_EPIFF|nr:hypothetical protein C2857_005635 [Epichloe festucae Fl1]